MKNLLSLLLIGSFCLVSSVLPAQVLQNSKEAVQDRQQVAADKNMLQRDAVEISEFQNTHLRLKEALLDGDRPSVQVLKKDLLLSMKREIEQGEVRIAQYQREVGQSSQELRSDRRELRRDRADSFQNEGDRRDDRRDQVRDRANKLDDQRDRRDDRFDLAAQKERTQRQKVIFEALTAHDFQTEAKDKMHLVSEFADLMEADLRALKQELGEDLQESREDRRERRDDRNERRENY